MQTVCHPKAPRGATTVSTPLLITLEFLAAPNMGAPQRLASGEFLLTVNGASQGTINIIQASTDLVNWEPMVTNLVGYTDWTFTDSSAINIANRFYRVLVQPAP